MMPSVNFTPTELRKGCLFLCYKNIAPNGASMQNFELLQLFYKFAKKARIFIVINFPNVVPTIKALFYLG